MCTFVGFILLSPFVLFHSTNSAFIDYSTGDIEGRIYAGMRAKPGMIPHQCYMEITQPGDEEFGTACGCSILTETWVLTAAHCVDGAEGVMVYAGLIDTLKKDEPQAQAIKADDWIVNEQYDSNPPFPNDVAVVRLSQPLKFNENVSSISLPPKSRTGTSWDNTKVTLSGWGATTRYSQDEDLSKGNLLKYTDTTVLPYKECKQILTNLPPKDICSSKERRNSGICKGDSGGPMTYKVNKTTIWVIGVTSFLVRYCDTRLPGGFLSVSEYLDWIEEKTGVTGG